MPERMNFCTYACTGPCRSLQGTSSSYCCMLIGYHLLLALLRYLDMHRHAHAPTFTFSIQINPVQHTLYQKTYPIMLRKQPPVKRHCGGSKALSAIVERTAFGPCPLEACDWHGVSRVCIDDVQEPANLAHRLNTINNLLTAETCRP